MTILYTTIFGGSNSLKPAPSGADRCVCFTDHADLTVESVGWERGHWETPTNPRREAWHLRCVPHLLFSDYARVVWVDASFLVIDLPKLLEDAGRAPIAALRHPDRSSHAHEGQKLVKYGQSHAQPIQRQLDAYERDGFTSDYCSVSCLLVRDRSADVQAFNETWDAEINTHPGDNTQVSLDYSAWKNGLRIKALAGTRHDNPYAIHDHADHKRRRQPYEKVA